MTATEQTILRAAEVSWAPGPRMRAVKIPQGEKAEVYIYVGPDFLEDDVRKMYPHKHVERRASNVFSVAFVFGCIV